MEYSGRLRLAVFARGSFPFCQLKKCQLTLCSTNMWANSHALHDGHASMTQRTPVHQVKYERSPLSVTGRDSACGLVAPAGTIASLCSIQHHSKSLTAPPPAHTGVILGSKAIFCCFLRNSTSPSFPTCLHEEHAALLFTEAKGGYHSPYFLSNLQ